jgi:hypothetical protein
MAIATEHYEKHNVRFHLIFTRGRRSRRMETLGSFQIGLWLYLPYFEIKEFKGLMVSF